MKIILLLVIQSLFIFSYSQKLPRSPHVKSTKIKVTYKQHHISFKSYLTDSAGDSVRNLINNQVTQITLVTLNPIPYPYLPPNYPDSLKKYQPYIYISAISSNNFSVDTNRFSSQVELNPIQLEELLIAIYSLKKEGSRIITSFGCYEPRHAFVFYNAKHEIIAYFEICLACREFRKSGSIPEIDPMTNLEYEKMKWLIESIVSE